MEWEYDFFSDWSDFSLIGFVFLILPSKKINFIYGYRSYLAKQNERNWQYAQKICTRYFLLFGES